MFKFTNTRYNSNTPNDPLQKLYDNANRQAAWRFKFFLVKAGFIAFLVLVMAIYIFAVNLSK